jgi:processive 1,2-diacylglycerol beta-glucosyltransferase
MHRKRVLLLSEAFGSGHTQAAYALAHGLRELDATVQTRVMELGKFLNPVVGSLIINAYRRTVSKQPKLVGLVYKKQYTKSFNKLTQLAIHRMFYRQAIQVIEQLKPDAIICTHPATSAVIARLKRLGLHIPLYTLITDYDAHATWTNPLVDKYLVSAPTVSHRLQYLGVGVDHIEVTGIPVHPNFWRNTDKEATRAQFGLTEMPTVLIMGGGWGMLQGDKLFDYIMSFREQIQFVYCAGTNEAMRKKLLANPQFQHRNVHVLGFTKDVNKLMDLSDLLITKPGGMTCTEGMSRGIPMLFYHPLPGQEEENCHHFMQHGFAEMLTSKLTIDRWFTRIQQLDENLLLRQRLLEKRNDYYDMETKSTEKPILVT